jgi:hypothetical protein
MKEPLLFTNNTKGGKEGEKWGLYGLEKAAW